jgi:ethanolamine ammonia-lyase large subunit
MAAQMALAEVPLARSLEEALVPYEKDEVTRLIFGSHDRDASIQISHMTVGDLRDCLAYSRVTGALME